MPAAVTAGRMRSGEMSPTPRRSWSRKVLRLRPAARPQRGITVRERIRVTARHLAVRLESFSPTRPRRRVRSRVTRKASRLAASVGSWRRVGPGATRITSRFTAVRSRAAIGPRIAGEASGWSVVAAVESSRTKPARHRAIRIRHAHPVRRIVCPQRVPAERSAESRESEMVEEKIVQKQPVSQPVQSPAPASEARNPENRPLRNTPVP